MLEFRDWKGQDGKEFKDLCRKLGGFAPGLEEILVREELLRKWGAERKEERLKNGENG